MKVLITGAGGQVGRELVAAFAGHDITATDHAALDVADREAVLALVTTVRPDAIVHTAAWTDVDGCESDVDRAWRVNALGTRHVVEAARRVGAHVCGLSTDYVFDGTLDRPYVEWDAPDPQSVYGASKLGAEHELAADPTATIVRTSWVCGAHGNNMVKTILRLAAEHDTLRFVDDQRGNPTFAPDLAHALHRLVIDRRPGLFHITNQGPVTWHQFARSVLRLAGKDENRVEPIATKDLTPPRPAPRPTNSVLANKAWELSNLPPLRHYEEPLEELINQLQT
jgi:dTDP-4-dehydrorhamnose reductase